MTKRVEIYSTAICPYCMRAKMLLEQKGVAYQEIRVDLDPEKRQEMMTRSNGGYTVPQIFIDDQHIGGCDDMMALEYQNKLDSLLND